MKYCTVRGSVLSIAVSAGFCVAMLQAQMPAISSTNLKDGALVTVGQLFDFINKNNPAKTSNFIVLGADKRSSFGAATKGFDQGWVRKNAGMSVMLRLDAAQEAATMGRQKKGPLLYFEVEGTRLYIFDPWPPLKVKTAKSKR